MSEFLLDFIDFNESVDYAVVLQLFCSYVLLLWVVIAVWVGVDAKKRFNSNKFSFLFFFLVLILNFPMLIFYFIVRPDEQFEGYEEWEAGGVHVPMVNFTGKDGVEMVIELKLKPSRINPNIQEDMKVDVSWESPQENMKLSPKISKSGKVSTHTDRKYSNTFSNLRGVVRKSLKEFREVSVNYKDRIQKQAKETMDKRKEKKSKKTEKPTKMEVKVKPAKKSKKGKKGKSKKSKKSSKKK